MSGGSKFCSTFCCKMICKQQATENFIVLDKSNDTSVPPKSYETFYVRK